MWQRKDLKVQAKSDIKKNYWAMIAVCFLMAILCMEYSISTQAINQYNDDKGFRGRVQNNTQSQGVATDVIDRLFPDRQDKIKEDLHPTKGVLASVFNTVAKSEATMNNIYRTVIHIVDNNSGITIFIGFLAIIVSALYEIFIKSILKIGERRFFLENHLYHETKIGRIFFLLKDKKYKGPVWIYFMMNLYLALWNLTIVGGIIKHYSYKMIPYIVAENPDISRKEAFDLSRQMMNGNKWRAFVLDLSFIGWYLLVALTFGLLGLLFVNPYRRSTETHLYLTLRQTAIEQKMTAIEQLNDTDLIVVPEGQSASHYPGLSHGREFHFAVDYHRSYRLINLILLFFTAAFIGWCWEVFLHLVQHGIFVNRGTMFGPWLPIYGAGGVGSLVILRKFINKPALTFGLTMVLCGTIEYVTAWVLEMNKGIKWWDYSGFLLNLNGRVCLEGLLVFAIAGCAFIYIIAPRLDQLFNKIPKKSKYCLCTVLILLFGLDTMYSHVHPNTGKGITDFSELAPKERTLYLETTAKKN